MKMRMHRRVRAGYSLAFVRARNLQAFGLGLTRFAATAREVAQSLSRVQADVTEFAWTFPEQPKESSRG